MIIKNSYYLSSATVFIQPKFPDAAAVGNVIDKVIDMIYLYEVMHGEKVRIQSSLSIGCTSSYNILISSYYIHVRLSLIIEVMMFPINYRSSFHLVLLDIVRWHLRCKIVIILQSKIELNDRLEYVINTRSFVESHLTMIHFSLISSRISNYIYSNIFPWTFVKETKNEYFVIATSPLI